MQRHWFFKLLAFLVAIVSGAALVLGAAGLLLGRPVNLYAMALESNRYSDVYNYTYSTAVEMVDWYLYSESDMSLEMYNRFFGSVNEELKPGEDCYVELYRRGSRTPIATGGVANDEYAWTNINTISRCGGRITLMPELPFYPPIEMTREEYESQVAYRQEQELLENTPRETTPTEVRDETPATTLPAADPTVGAGVFDSIPQVGENVSHYGYYLVPAGSPTSLEDIDPTGSGQLYYEWLDAEEVSGGTVYRIEYFELEEFEVFTGLTQEQFDTVFSYDFTEDPLHQLLIHYENLFPTLTIAGAAGLLLSILWLCLMAGRKPGSDELRPEGLNRLPLDLYLVAVGLGLIGAAAVALGYADEVIYRASHGYIGSDVELWMEVALYPLLGGGCGLLLAMFTMACAAQMKVGDNYWAKHTLIGSCIHLVRMAGWEILKGCWKAVKACALGVWNFLRRCGRAAGSLYGMLPLMWQWLAATGVLWLTMFLAFLMATEMYNPWPLILLIPVTILLVIYGAYCFGKLRSAAKNMAGGHLESKITDQLMLGCFKDFADDLNALDDACVRAAKEQMKSERMKSELITNVSHDIKTPLTSIINYVDLLQKAETGEQREEYLEVLDRQSQKLKKLIEDLMEMSKASSGSMAVEIVPTDVAEAVNQAMGEYADAMERCNLAVLARLPREPLMAMCDGKLLWRVLSNCFGNVVKYAMPGTRVYVDAALRGNRVELSIKNISAQMLNITAEELMERFVRGDASRNTEGNGLGLNIAKSLMEVQGGTLELLVDGDLFKVVLTLAAAEDA